MDVDTPPRPFDPVVIPGTTGITIDDEPGTWLSCIVVQITIGYYVVVNGHARDGTADLYALPADVVNRAI